MTWLTPDSAQRAQQNSLAGPGRCQLCDTPVWRYVTSADRTRLVMFTEHATGSFDFPATDQSHPLIRFVGKGKGCLQHHNCLEDRA